MFFGGLVSAGAQVGNLCAIAGTVKDASGAVVPEATIRITNQATYVSQSVRSSEEGFFAVEALPAGDYSATISKDGFRQHLTRNIHLDPGQRRNLDVDLIVGRVEVTVNENAETIAVQRESSETGGTISAQEVSNLMLNGRNFQSLTQIVPGVSNILGASQLTGNGNAVLNTVIVNGSSVENTAFSLDGIYNTVPSAFFQIDVMPVLDSISEVRVLKTNYSAKYGMAGSGQILVETKSGGNVYHGTGYDYIRNDSFATARNYFLLGPPSLHQNIFGYALGGPVRIPHIYNSDGNKKTYFFASGEWRISHIAATLTSRKMFTPGMRTGDLSGDPFLPSGGLTLDASSQALLTAKGIDPSTCLSAGSNGAVNQVNSACFDPTAVALMNAYWPLPNDPSLGIGGYINNGIQNNSQMDQVYRVDHSIDSKNALMVRVSYEESNNVQPSRNFNDPAPNPGAAVYTPGFNGTVRWVSNLSQRLINTASIGETYTKGHTNISNYTMPSGATIAQAYPGADPLNRIPNIILSTSYWAWLGVGALPAITTDADTIFSDDLIWVRGRHVLQFGFMYLKGSKTQNAAVFPAPMGVFYVTGGHTGDVVSDYLLGLDSTYTQANMQRQGRFHYGWSESYAQDDWKIMPRLTLNLGLRWSYFSPETIDGNQLTSFSAKNFVAANAPLIQQTNGAFVFNVNGQPVTASGSVADLTNGLVFAGQNGTPAGFYQAKKSYFGPRIGFAYALTSDNKTALYGGYGIGYTPVGLERNPTFLTNPPFIQSTTVSNGLISQPLFGAPQNTLGPVSLTVFGPDFQATRTETYSLTVERDLFPHAVFTLGYEGSMSQHVLAEGYDQNFPLPGTSANSAACAALSPTPEPSANYQFDPCINKVPSGGPLVNSTFYRPYAGYTSINSTFSGGNANFNSMQTSFIYRGHALQVNLAYTLGKSLTNVVPGGAGVQYDQAATYQNPRQVGAEYGPPDYDRRHVFTAAWVYELPFFRWASIRAVRSLAGGWTFSGLSVMESGFALTPTLSAPFAGLATRPNLIAPVQITGNPHAWVNPNSFQQPAFGFFGNAGTGIIRGPREIAFNVATGKSFRVTERLKLEFRVEAFNVANHPNFLNINTAFNPTNTTSFGQALTAGDPRIMEGMLRIRF
jgi:hypothetical protein